MLTRPKDNILFLSFYLSYILWLVSDMKQYFVSMCSFSVKCLPLERRLENGENPTDEDTNCTTMVTIVKA